MSAIEILPDEDELLAAELAFGLIDDDERPAAEARVTTDAPFREAHRRWQDYAVAMLGARAEPPRPSLWHAIEARLPANDAAPINRAATSNRWWQAGTAVASAAAVVLAVIAFERAPQPIAPPPIPPAIVQSPPAARPPLVAILTGEPGKGAIAVSFDSASGRLTLAPTGLVLDQRDAELWVIPEGQPPRSLGVFAAASTASKAPPANLVGALKAGATLAVSVEPIGGSPTGLPTGPVILSGKISQA